MQDIILEQNKHNTEEQTTKQNWFKRMIVKFGFWGFMFFFLKGLILYIIIPFIAVKFGIDIFEELKAFFGKLF